MMDFEKESEIMDMKEEMMSDAIDDAMGEEGDDEERWVSSKHSDAYALTTVKICLQLCFHETDARKKSLRPFSSVPFPWRGCGRG